MSFCPNFFKKKQKTKADKEAARNLKTAIFSNIVTRLK